MSTDRLSHLQKRIQGYYEQLEDKENALLFAAVGNKAIIKQQIEHLKPEIEQAERDYWTYWRSKGTQLEISDADAEAINAEILLEVELLGDNPGVQQHQELVKLLNDIKVELNKPAPAAGKLKTAIPILPGFLSYEMELDTEGFLRRIFPMFAKLGGKLKKT